MNCWRRRARAMERDPRAQNSFTHFRAVPKPPANLLYGSPRSAVTTRPQLHRRKLLMSKEHEAGGEEWVKSPVPPLIQIPILNWVGPGPQCTAIAQALVRLPTHAAAPAERPRPPLSIRFVTKVHWVPTSLCVLRGPSRAQSQDCGTPQGHPAGERNVPAWGVAGQAGIGLCLLTQERKR